MDRLPLVPGKNGQQKEELFRRQAHKLATRIAKLTPAQEIERPQSVRRLSDHSMHYELPQSWSSEGFRVRVPLIMLVFRTTGP